MIEVSIKNKFLRTRIVIEPLFYTYEEFGGTVHFFQLIILYDLHDFAHVYHIDIRKFPCYCTI